MVDRVRRAAIEHMSTNKRRFKLTTAQYIALYKDAKCVVCGAVVSWVDGKEARLVIDHDHEKTGPESIRGILCHSCNLAIGWAEDNPAILEALAAYLRRYAAEGGPFRRNT